MHLLWVANFAADTGYAWETIEAVFRRVGERVVRDGHRVTVCYASPAGSPSRVMRGAPFEFAAFDYGRGRARDFVRLLRERGVDALYLTDRPTWSWRYPLYRLAGVRRIIVHDRTSGARTVRGPRYTWPSGRCTSSPGSRPTPLSRYRTSSATGWSR